MSEQPDLHKRLNSIGVLVAIVLSTASFALSLVAYFDKKERVAFSNYTTSKCPVPLIKDQGKFETALCWSVTLSNESTERLSIRDVNIIDNSTTQNLTHLRKFSLVLTPQGNPLDLPIAVDGGDTRQIIVRVPVVLAPEIAAIVEAYKTPLNGKEILLQNLLSFVEYHGMDLLGDVVTDYKQSQYQDTLNLHVRSDLQRSFNVIFTTGRGYQATVRLSTFN